MVNVSGAPANGEVALVSEQLGEQLGTGYRFPGSPWLMRILSPFPSKSGSFQTASISAAASSVNQRSVSRSVVIDCLERCLVIRSIGGTIPTSRVPLPNEYPVPDSAPDSAGDMTLQSGKCFVEAMALKSCETSGATRVP